MSLKQWGIIPYDDDVFIAFMKDMLHTSLNTGGEIVTVF